MHGTALAHEESDDITISRALGVLNGQILTGASIEPGSRTRFTFDLGCALASYPAPPGTYGPIPAQQWT